MEQKKWYTANTGNSQGLVIEEGTGRNVAVTYDVKDAKLIAQAPRMLDLLKNLTTFLGEFDTVKQSESMRLIEALAWSIISEIGE